MFTRYLLPLLALAGFLFGVYMVVTGNKPIPVAEAVAQPAQAPFASFIAGSGLVEARSENIAIGTPLPGVVTRVAVRAGERVKAGQILFELDDREARAEEGVRRAATARARAGVEEAAASLKEAAILLQLAESVDDRRAISVEELERRRNAHAIARSRLDSAKAQVGQAEAELTAVRTTLDRLRVRALIDGEVLKVNVHPGEFAMAGITNPPLLVLGNLTELRIRVDIDENDAWRFRKDAKAVAYLRGNRDLKAELSFAYVEPYVIPKRSLTGDSTERVDTRVLQVLYRFDPSQLAAYVGQQMDVFIEAPDMIPQTAADRPPPDTRVLP